MEINKIDKEHYLKIRKNVSDLIKQAANENDTTGSIVLDVAPEIHKGAAEHFKNATIKTLDLDPNSKADYIADLCKNNSGYLLDETFDVIICTEVLEHTENPFNAINELYRILKIGGTLYLSTPFNFRIHGPLPDNWRFTIHGLNTLLKNFKEVKIDELQDENRNLMPIQYTVVAKK